MADLSLRPRPGTGKSREPYVGFGRLKTIEIVSGALGRVQSVETLFSSTGSGTMISLWSSIRAERRRQGGRADYSANTLPVHPLRL
jgi:hypothetical protein